MTTATQHTPPQYENKATDVDAIIVGAGFSGLYMLQRLRDLGLSGRLYESGTDVGGTWYWNRYPGARSDSDSIVYCFSEYFSEELLRKWEWSERYPAQPEILGYLQWVADRLDLRRDIQFSTRVSSATYDEARNCWDITTDADERLSARYFIPAVGFLSKPSIPEFPGLDQFTGACYHTARLPSEGVDFAGKRVAVVGNGATAVQIVPEVAKQAAGVWEFQRNPYHCLPARNHKLDEDDWREIHAHHKEIWDQARGNFGGFPYADFVGAGDDFSSEQRARLFEKGWMKGGFPLAFSTFSDVLTSRETNNAYLSFMADRIDHIVHDKDVAEAVTPKDPFCGKRPPLEHGYYAAFNRDNVHLVDTKRAPIEEITPRGIRTRDGEYEFDIILLATGFDASTGSLLSMNVRGREGLSLQEKWADKPLDYLAMMVHGFPNMFMVYCGPYNPAILTNAPTLIEQQGEWILGCLDYLHRNSYDYAEPRKQSEDQFVALHEEIADSTLIPETASWWTGTNIPGKPRGLLSWCGGFPEYKRICDEAAEDSYSGLIVQAH